MRVTLERTGCEAELCQDGAVEGPASSLSSAFSSAQEKFIPRSSPIAPKRRCARSFGARIDPQSVLCSDGWPGYDGLVDVGYDKHVRIANRNPSPMATLTSTGLKPSGASPSGAWLSSTASKPTLSFISKSASGAITNLLPFSSKTS